MVERYDASSIMWGVDGLPIHPKPNGEWVRYSDYAALEAQLAERVKVKTLEWTRGWMNAEAQTEIGQYTITYRRDGSFEWGIGILKGWSSSWDEAKAAAQADFDRRILSALASHPRDTSTVDAHETVNVSDKPKGQQEPVAERGVDFVNAINNGTVRINKEMVPEYTRPSERAVTEAMIGALKEARSVIYDTQQACLFDDDDGQIGVTEDAVISSYHFQKLCSALGVVDHALTAAQEAGKP